MENRNTVHIRQKFNFNKKGRNVKNYNEKKNAKRPPLKSFSVQFSENDLQVTAYDEQQKKLQASVRE